MDNYDTVIIGAGIIGTAIFASLSEAGMRCLLIESQRVGLGATGYSGAMVRLAHQDPDSVAAAGLGLDRYSDFEDESNGRVSLTRCGHLYFGTQDDLKDILPHVQAVSSAATILDRDEISNRFSGMHVTADYALFEPEAGFADPIAFAQHQASIGIARGGVLTEATTVQHLILKDSAVAGVETNQGRINCRRIVLALGANTSALLKRHNVIVDGMWSQKIQVSQFHLEEETAQWPGFVDDVLGLNGLPCKGDGRYYFGLPTGQRDLPEFETRSAHAGHSERTRITAAKLFPAASTARAEGAMCHADCYSDQPIAHIGPLDHGPDGLCLATGFSGGGFKMAPYAAKRVAEILTGSDPIYRT